MIHTTETRLTVVSGHISPARFVSLTEELQDRGLTTDALVSALVGTWLDETTGPGYRCTCLHCPGNFRTAARRSRLPLAG